MSFDLDIELFAQATVRATEQVARGTFIDASTRIIRRTPVDTGRARGNWFAEVDGFSSQTTEATDKSGRQSNARARNAAFGFRVGQSVSLVNNLPYIIPLEDGSSTQAPGGMVKITFTELETALAARAAAVR